MASAARCGSVAGAASSSTVPSLRYKADGRPYVDFHLEGNRYRKSLSPTAIPEEKAEAIFTQFMENNWPLLQEHGAKLLGKTTKPTRRGGGYFDAQRLDALRGWYVDEYMPSLGRTDGTLKNIALATGLFVDFMESRGVRRVRELAEQPAMIDAWRADAMEKHTPRTIRVHMGVAKSMLVVAAERFPAIADDARRITSIRWRPPHCPPQVYEALTADDVRTIIDYARRKGGGMGAAIEFMALTGWRPSDVAGLKWANVDEESSTATIVIQKTGTPFACSLSSAAMDVIKSAPRRGRSVFIAKDGKPITARSLATATKRLMDYDAGIEGTARSLRVAFITHLFELGYDREVARQLTGHSSDAIADYVHMRRKRLSTIADGYADAIGTFD